MSWGPKTNTRAPTSLRCKIRTRTSMSGGKSAGKPGLLGGVRGGDALLPRVGVRAPGDAERLPDPARVKLEPEEAPSLPLAWSASVISFSRTRRSRSSSLSRSLQGSGSGYMFSFGLPARFRVQGLCSLSDFLQDLGSKYVLSRAPCKMWRGWVLASPDTSRQDGVCLFHGPPMLQE